MKYEVASLNTKKTLANSLKELMKKETFSKITITDIINDCGLNRKTFYYHFEDKYALLRWILENEAIEIVKEFNFSTDYKEAINFVLDYIDNNEYMISCVYDSIGRDELKRFFANDFNDITFKIITIGEKESNKKLDIKYKQFITELYTEALSGMIVNWIKDKNHLDRNTLIEYIVRTIKESILGIIKNY